MAELLGSLLGWCWAHRTPVIALVVVVALIAPKPAQGQFIDWAAIVGAINAINTAITNVIGGALKAMNETLSSINGIISAVQNLFQNVVYPQSAIVRARGLVGQVMSIYNQIRAIAQTAVNSATLANPAHARTEPALAGPAADSQCEREFSECVPGSTSGHKRRTRDAECD